MRVVLLHPQRKDQTFMCLVSEGAERTNRWKTKSVFTGRPSFVHVSHNAKHIRTTERSNLSSFDRKMDVLIERAFHQDIEPQRQKLREWLQSFTPLQFWTGLFLFIVVIYGLKIWSIVREQQEFERNPPQAYLGMPGQ
jgi:hypothetical protein